MSSVTLAEPGRPAPSRPSPPRPPSPTLADVAALAGVSQATASRVVNGSARVSGEAREQVQSAIARLGYVPRRPAAAAPDRDAPKGSIAMLVAGSSARYFSVPFFTRLLEGASDTLSAAGFQLAFLSVHNQGEYSSAGHYLRRGGIDGVLLISAHGQERLLPALRACALPVVICGRPLTPGGTCYVAADNAGGARAAVNHLLDTGRTRVATIAGPRDLTAGIDRLAGYREALSAAGLPGLVGSGDFSLASGEYAMTGLLDRSPDLDAVFAASDLMAVGALRALRRAGRRVPDDVAVVGFDDDPVARHTLPPLTTVRQPVEEQGTALAQRVLALIGQRDTAPEHQELPTSLVRRESA
jgi:DNA-binding LacI/PurR family transcriptional regulator